MESIDLKRIDNNSDYCFIDANKQDNIESFMRNLEILIQETKDRGYVDKYVTLRNDEFFPETFQWILNFEKTQGLYKRLVAWIKPTKNSGFFRSLLGNNNLRETEELNIFIPTDFVSTKHFTVNAPLGLTGEYNTVPANRTFTIMDDLEFALGYGYNYSLSGRDYYRDITHEPLPISENAVVFISVEDYQNIKDNKELMKLLSQRKLIVFSGDRALAICMYMVDCGILPFRPWEEIDDIFKVNNRIAAMFDDELNEIIKESLKKKCREYGIHYDYNHGYVDGHFTHTVDSHIHGDNADKTVKEFFQYAKKSYCEERGCNECERILAEWEKNKIITVPTKNNNGEESISFEIPPPINQMPDCPMAQLSENDVLLSSKEEAWNRFINIIGIDNFKSLLNNFNNKKQEELIQSRKEYLESRKGITDEQRTSFQETIRLLNQNIKYLNVDNYSTELTKLILKFYGSTNLDEQFEASKEISLIIKRKIAEEQTSAQQLAGDSYSDSEAATNNDNGKSL